MSLNFSPVFHVDFCLAFGGALQFDLIVAGKSNKEIIEKLFIELSTLKTHINKIYKTLEVSSRKEARALNNIDKSVD